MDTAECLDLEPGRRSGRGRMDPRQSKGRMQRAGDHTVEIKHLAFSVGHESPHPVVPSWLVSLFLCALISSSKEQAD